MMRQIRRPGRPLLRGLPEGEARRRLTYFIQRDVPMLLKGLPVLEDLAPQIGGVVIRAPGCIWTAGLSSASVTP